MFGRGAALYWAIAGALLGAGAWFAVSTDVMFALGFAGLAAACLLVAASCLLAPPKPRRGDEPEAAPQRRRNWRP
jgi:hypothetical protein